LTDYLEYLHFVAIQYSGRKILQTTSRLVFAPFTGDIKALGGQDPGKVLGQQGIFYRLQGYFAPVAFSSEGAECIALMESLFMALLINLFRLVIPMRQIK